MLTARRALAIALMCFGAAVAASVVVAWMSDPSFAQGNPFGAPRSAPPDGLVGWVLAKQSEFYRGLSTSIRAAKVDGSAVWGLFGLSFAYGVFHAAGPGHGKAVISSYVVANGETWRRGVALSFASALAAGAGGGGYRRYRRRAARRDAPRDGWHGVVDRSVQLQPDRDCLARGCCG